MNKAVKLTMFGLGVVATVFVVALIVFAATFDLNDYKTRISKAVMNETGRTLTFDGDLSLSLFPRVGVTFGGVELSNAPDFNKKPMVQVLSAQVSVRVLPLLKGQIKFGELDLDGLTLNLSRNDKGLSNWDDLVGQSKKATPVEDEDNEPFSLEIAGLEVSNANLFWDDKKSETQFFLRGVNLKTGMISEGSPFPVKANLEFECTKPEVQGAVTLVGTSSLDFTNRVYNYKNTKITLAAEGKGIPGGKFAADLTMQSMDLDFAKEYATLTGLTATAYGTTVSMDGTLDGITSGFKKLAGHVSVPTFDAKIALKELAIPGLETADPKVMTQLGGTVDFVFTPTQLHIKKLDAQLDDTSISGKARLKFDVGEKEYFARLNVGNIDLDRYLPPDHEAKTEQSKEANGAIAKGVRVVDSAFLRELNLDVEAKAQALRIDGIWLQNVNAVAKARHGLVRISPVSADLYGGKLTGGATINAMSTYPKTDVIAGLDEVGIDALSKDVLGDESYKGILNFNAAISCEGERIPAMLRSMNGKVGFHLANGVFPGVDLFRMVKSTHDSKDKSGGKVTAVKTDSTKFGSISGSGVITSGVLRNRDLEVKAPGLRADGKGSVVLPTRALDYLLKVKLVPSSEGQGGKSSDQMFGVMVPIRVSGTLEDPHYWVSITEYVKALGGAVIGTAGSVIGGVTNAIKGIGSALIGGSSKKEDAKDKDKILP